MIKCGAWLFGSGGALLGRCRAGPGLWGVARALLACQGAAGALKVPHYLSLFTYPTSLLLSLGSKQGIQPPAPSNIQAGPGIVSAAPHPTGLPDPTHVNPNFVC